MFFLQFFLYFKITENSLFFKNFIKNFHVKSNILLFKKILFYNKNLKFLTQHHKTYLKLINGRIGCDFFEK